MRDLLDDIDRWRADGRAVVLARVVDLEGSGPRGPGAGYLGVMGSRNTHRDRLERLRAEGVPPESLERLHAPIGLDIGALTPEETAISICAEIIAERAGLDIVRPLRQLSTPIHH